MSEPLYVRNVDVSRFHTILSKIGFKDWSFRVTVEMGIPFLYIQVDEGVCNVTGQPMAWQSRKWRLSPHMTDGEVVQTAFKAALTAMEHEVREQFTFMGAAVFDPHYDIYKLVELRKSPDALKERDAA